MKTYLTIISLIAALTGVISAGPAESTPAEVAELIKGKGKLVFEDDFNREESDDSKEDLGKGWVTNSKKRAAGTKQADLKGESILITMAKHADHGVSVRHDAPYDDGVIQARFKMHDDKGISFNFNDPKCKASHAGHICAVGVKPGKVMLRDGKTGIFDNKIREKKLSGASKKEINALTKDKFAYGKVKLETGKWYDITILIRGDVMSAWIDGKKVGELKSPGLDHEVKQNIAFAVSGTAEVDQLRIWSLEK
jgi:hypothetical protein